LIGDFNQKLTGDLTWMSINTDMFLTRMSINTDVFCLVAQVLSDGMPR